ncbi:alkaline proteinase [Colletotrichum kahawae]|uniref:Alkaline proteinase n=1 Tax=Colletotrichum kahawae TaxID=34407 RepID=A0AAD9Y778_COLKA|nr:alkaline proteinase [Colletotrichum kahawae]
MHNHATFILLSLLASGEGIFARPHDHSPVHRHHVRNGLILPRVDGNGTSTNNTQVPVPVPPPATSRKASSSLYSASHTSSAPLTSRPPASQTASSAPAASTTPAAQKTVSNGEVATGLAVGTIVAAGVGGGYLLLAGQYFSMAAGSVAQVTGAGASGLASGLSSLSGPEPQQVDKPEDPPEDNGDQNQPTPSVQNTDQPFSTSLPLDLPTTSSVFSYTFTTSQASATSSAAPAPKYIIVPDSKGKATDFEAVESSLSGSVGSSLVTVEDDEDKSTLFLAAPLSPQQAKDLETKPGVGAVTEDIDLGDMNKLVAEEPYNPADAAGPSVPPPALTKDPLKLAKQPQKIVRQSGYDVETENPTKPSHEDAGELSVLSQEPGKPRGSTFAYDEVAGQGITVYILGTGMNLNSPDIQDAVGTKDFIFAPGSAETKVDDYPLIGYPDGTCMASKIFGPKYGVAKKANVVMVKLSGGSGLMGMITMTEMLTALAMVKNDITTRKLKGKAVVNLSYTTPMSDPEAIAAYKEILVKMMDDDIVLVAPTGISNNNNGSEANDQYPAAFAKDTALIAVSGVNGKGARMDWSPGSEKDGVTAAAPVTGRCAYKNLDPKSKDTKKQQDISRLYYSDGVAAATVAGVAAGLMAQADYTTQLQVPGKVAANVKELVQGLAWVRAEGGPPVAWNGVAPYGNACVLNKRQDGGDSCSAAPSAAPTAAPTAAPSAPATLPPKPTYNVPGTWKKQYEGDVNYSFDYTTSSGSASDGYTGDDPLSWCLGKCTDACVSVFLTRVNQKQTSGYNTYFICNQYDKVWSNDFLQKLSSSDYDAGIALE